MENYNLEVETKTLTNREFLVKLYQYFLDGLLVKQEHPTLPLIIWNYTEKVQYDKLWDETLLYCRGLITDTKGNIIVKPFDKFFNFEEIQDKSVIPWSDSHVLIQEKIDGSLGILFNYNRNFSINLQPFFSILERFIENYNQILNQAIYLLYKMYLLVEYNVFLHFYHLYIIIQNYL